MARKPLDQGGFEPIKRHQRLDWDTDSTAQRGEAKKRELGQSTRKQPRFAGIFRRRTKKF